MLVLALVMDLSSCVFKYDDAVFWFFKYNDAVLVMDLYLDFYLLLELLCFGSLSTMMMC